jgi:hypothetical protein
MTTGLRNTITTADKYGPGAGNVKAGNHSRPALAERREVGHAGRPFGHLARACVTSENAKITAEARTGRILRSEDVAQRPLPG